MKTKADFQRKSQCPHCGHSMDCGQLVANLDDAASIPVKGDLGVCIECTGFFVYVDDQGSCIALSPRAWAELRLEEQSELLEARMMIKAAKFQ